MNTYSCLEIQEQLLTQQKINRDQSRIIDSKQQIIEDQARLINSQQQLIDMMYENIQILKDDISKLQVEGEEGSSSHYQHHQNCYHHQNQHRQKNPSYSSSNCGDNSNENLSSNDFDNDRNNGYKVFLKNVRPQLSVKTLKNQLERSFGKINEITTIKKQCAYVYFRDRADYVRALKEGSINIEGTLINISNGPDK